MLHSPDVVDLCHALFDNNSCLALITECLVHSHKGTPSPGHPADFMTLPVSGVALNAALAAADWKKLLLLRKQKQLQPLSNL